VDPMSGELELLWCDLNRARLAAGEWSPECAALAERIIVLTRAAPQVGGIRGTPWYKVPLLLLRDGTYERILRDAGIAFAPVDHELVAALYERERERQDNEISHFVDRRRRQ
jgi:hypothetical protein